MQPARLFRTWVTITAHSSTRLTTAARVGIRRSRPCGRSPVRTRVVARDRAEARVPAADLAVAPPVVAARAAGRVAVRAVARAALARQPGVPRRFIPAA